MALTLYSTNFTSGKSFGTTIGSPTSPLYAGDVLVVVVVTDQIDISAGNTNYHLSITDVFDAITWIKENEYTIGNVTTSLWFGKIIENVTGGSGGNYTINLAGSGGAVNVHHYRFNNSQSASLIDGPSVSRSTTGAVNIGTTPVSGTDNTAILMIGTGREGRDSGISTPAGFTGNYTTTTGQGASSNNELNTAYKIITNFDGSNQSVEPAAWTSPFAMLGGLVYEPTGGAPPPTPKRIFNIS